MSRGTAVVVGDGTGGLAAAIGLRRIGWSAVALEQAPAVTDVGAGLSLWPNALRGFDALGGGRQVRASGVSAVSRGGIRLPWGKWLRRRHPGDIQVLMVHPGRAKPAAGGRAAGRLGKHRRTGDLYQGAIRRCVTVTWRAAARARCPVISSSAPTASTRRYGSSSGRRRNRRSSTAGPPGAASRRQAIEDAAVLAASLSHHGDPLTALAWYEEQRRPRTQAMTRATRQVHQRWTGWAPPAIPHYDGGS